MLLAARPELGAVVLSRSLYFSSKAKPTSLDVSAQALTDAISAIYDCAVDPDHWPDALRRIGELCESPRGALNVQDLRKPQLKKLYDYGYSPDFWRQYENYIDVSPITSALGLMDVGGVLTLRMACSDKELFESRYYNELLKPHGYLDFIGLLALRSSGRVAGVHVCRSLNEPRYGQREVDLLRLLSPHICRALAIAEALDLRTLKSDMLEKAFDALVAGVFLIARDGRVVYMNDVARRQIKSQALRIVNDRLLPSNFEARAALAKAIQALSQDETEAAPCGHSIALPDTNGAGFVATLLPLQSGSRQKVMAPFSACVAVFVQDPTQTPAYPGEAFARLYGLTGAELRVLLALAQGLGAKEVADMLGVGETTIRTHISRILAKTGVTRQTDLLCLLQNSTPPIRRA